MILSMRVGTLSKLCPGPGISSRAPIDSDVSNRTITLERSRFSCQVCVAGMRKTRAMRA